MDDPSSINTQIPVYASKPEILQMSKDMNFVAIFVIIYGAFCCLSIIGAVVGIPVIFAALRLKESAEAFRHYSSREDTSALNYAFEKLSNSFRIVKILIIVTLVFYAVALISFLMIVLPLLKNLPMGDFNI